MKTKIFQLLFAILVVSLEVSAQDTYQVFPTEGFKVKCGCKLQPNSLFIQMAKQQQIKDVIAAYMCAEYENSPEYGVIVNINIYDESKSYKDIKPQYHAYFEKKCLEKYADNLEGASINYKYTDYQGVNAVEYDYYMNDLPARAIYFFKDKKSYLLQVATRNNLTPKYQALKSSFELF
jgi:hypothetical protein